MPGCERKRLLACCNGTPACVVIIDMKKSFIIIYGFLLLFTSCKKDDADCNGTIIRKAIVENDQALIRTEINKICAGIPVVQTSGVPDGLKRSLDELVDKLNKTCSIETTVLCYFCIDTLPEQAEIRMTSGATSRTIDISYTNDKKLVFVNMHD